MEPTNIDTTSVSHGGHHYTEQVVLLKGQVVWLSRHAFVIAVYLLL